ncbi:MAG TPA: glycoside hydrolase family 31 protein [Symbiobacteriaceae bacterium]|nr:glycoside hydrolase family 31 protein [Symbiobacteriaceae bacterium]
MTSCVSMAAAGGYVSVAALSSHILRIRIGPAPLKPRSSWAVVMEDRPQVAVAVSETPQEMMLATDGLRVTVRRQDLHLTIARADGAPVLEDALPGAEFPPGGGTALTKRLQADTRLYGLGQRMGFLDKRGETVTMWATDDPLHHPGRDALYQAIPFVLALQPGGAYGIFLDSPAFTQFDLGKTQSDRLRIQTAESELDYYVIVADSPKGVLNGYSELTGRTPLPPRWSLGYQQCRWSYYPEERVREVAREFRSRQIPCDVIYLDIDHMDGYRVFTWDQGRFPDPAQLVADLRAQGFRVVTIVDPGVKADPAYSVFQEGLAGRHFMTTPDGEVYIGKVWPGPAAFPDFLQESTRRWWGRQHAQLLHLGVAGIWNDMNEPANFTDASVTGQFKGTVPGTLLQGEAECKQPHALVHNLYGLAMASATTAALQELRPKERPFLVTRSGYAGIQRYAAVWMGDNHSWWEHLLQAVPMCLGMGLSGVPFVGTDCGGFSGDATAELLVRWTQLGAFTPFFRNHSAAGTRSQEPWAFGPETEALVADAIRLRYRFLPYLYTLFAEARRTGLPVMRPLLLEYPDDERTHNLSDQFLLGEDLLVAPVYQPGAVTRMVYLPRGEWVDYWTGALYPGGQYTVADAPLHRIPLFVRQGAILPLGPVVQHTGEPAKSLTFDIFGSGAGHVYEDDGASMDYLAGDWSITRVTSRVEAGRTLVTVQPPEGKYRPVRSEVLLRLRNHRAPAAVTADGHPLSWRLEGNDLVVAVAVLDGTEQLLVEISGR